MDRCIGESWVRWWRGFGSVEIGGLPMSPMMDRSRSLMMGWMWCDVGGVDLVAPWVKWFRRSGFVLSPIWVLCGFCSEAWIDVGGVGGGVDLVAPWVKWFRRSCFVLSPI